jgi:putative SOS response-associated peptidase YedK
MCGRFALTVTPELLKKVFGYEELPNFPPLTNISPTQPVVTITQDHQKRHFQLMRWGFIPSWVKDPADFPLLFTQEVKLFRRSRHFVPRFGTADV